MSEHPPPKSDPVDETPELGGGRSSLSPADRMVAEGEDKGRRVARTLASGTFWTALGEVLEGAVDIATSILAARLLSPHDFGTMRIVAIAMILLEKLSSTGFDAALVHREKDVHDYLDVAWTWHFIRGFGIAALLCAMGPLAASIYDQPVLLPLFVVCATSAVMRGAANIGTVFFSRQLDFRKLFGIRIARTLLRILVFIPAIFYFQSVWALALSYVGGAAAALIVSFVSHPYRPRFRWDLPKLLELVRYGKWITAFAVIGFVLTEGDDLFVSKYLGIAALGVYQLAYDISNLPTTKVTHVLGSIGMPTYARLQNDPVELRAAFVRVMRAALLLTAPVSVLIWVLVPDLVAHVFGPKWEGMIPIVRILVLSGFVRSVSALGGPLYQAIGRPDLDFRMNLPRFVVMVTLLWPFSAYWGLEGASVVVLLALLTTLPPWFSAIREFVNVSVRDVLRDNALAVIVAVLLALAHLSVRPWFDESVGGALAGLVGMFVVWLGALALLGRFTRYDLMAEVRRVQSSLKRA